MLAFAALGATGAELRALGVLHAHHQALLMRGSRELHNGYGQTSFATGEPEMVNGEYMIWHGFADNNCPLEVEASANAIIHRRISFPKQKLNHLGLFM